MLKTKGFLTPKGLDPKAQGKRSAALGRTETRIPTLKGLHKRPVSRDAWNPFRVCARPSLEKEEGRCRHCQHATGNLLEGTLRVRIPPGKGWPPAGSESCVVARQRVLRSVDSEWGSRASEPRNRGSRRGRRRTLYRRQHSCTEVAWCEEPVRGQGPRQTHTGDPPGTWETQSSPSRSRVGPRDTNKSRLVGEECPHPTGANSGHETVPLSEGNEARRDGRLGVRVPHSTREAGEPTPWGPVGRKGAPEHRTVRGKDVENTDSG